MEDKNYKNPSPSQSNGEWKKNPLGTAVSTTEKWAIRIVFKTKTSQGSSLPSSDKTLWKVEIFWTLFTNLCLLKWVWMEHTTLKSNSTTYVKSLISSTLHDLIIRRTLTAPSLSTLSSGLIILLDPQIKLENQLKKKFSWKFLTANFRQKCKKKRSDDRTKAKIPWR